MQGLRPLADPLAPVHETVQPAVYGVLDLAGARDLPGSVHQAIHFLWVHPSFTFNAPHVFTFDSSGSSLSVMALAEENRLGGGGASSSAGSFLAEASRVLDFKSVLRLPTFGGQEGQWADFKFKFLNAAAVLGIEELLQEAARLGSEPDLASMPPDGAEKARGIYALLAGSCSGTALVLTRATAHRNGFAAWHKLCKHYEPLLPSRQTALLAGLLRPDLSGPSIVEAVTKWELGVEEWEVQSGMRLQDPVKCSVIVTHAPRAVVSHLRSASAEVCESFSKLKDYLRTWEVRGLHFDAAGHVVDTARTRPSNPGEAMELDAVSWRRKGGKGAGKGGG